MSKATAHKQIDDGIATAAPVQATTAELDEFEKFFREQVEPAVKSGGSVSSAAGNRMDDPLMAELARIVGQRPVAPAAPKMPPAFDPFAPTAMKDDPEHDPLKAFEEELRRFDAAHQKAQPAAYIAPEPLYEPAATDFRGDFRGDFHAEPAVAVQAPIPAGYHAGAQDVSLDMADLRGTASPNGAAPVAYDPVPYEQTVVAPGDSQAVIAPDLAPEPEERPRSKRVLMMLGAAAAIAVVGVVGTLGFGSRPKMSGDAPVIAAKSGPTKEKPADPGGVEISGQDRQVLAKKTEEPKGSTTVVTREEQPVDLNQTPKREVSRVILPNSNGPAPQGGPILMPQGSQQPATQGQPATTQGGLEPKKVRSVRISGDGETTAATSAPAPAPAPAPRATAPSMAAAPVPAPVTAPVAAPKNEARPTTARPQAANTTPQPARPAQPAPVRQAPAASGEDAPLSLQPSNARAAAPQRTAATTPAPVAASGGFAVQLAAPGSEAEARTVINRVKSQHGDALGSYSPGVRKADVGGRTVYRVRVGGLSRDAANALCSKLKEDGASCFVAAN